LTEIDTYHPLPGRADAINQAQHRVRHLGIFDPVPCSVAPNDETMRRPDSEVCVDQQELQPSSAWCEGHARRELFHSSMTIVRSAWIKRSGQPVSDRLNPRRLARGASIAAFCRSGREAVDWQRGRPAPRLDKDRRQQKRGVGRPKTCNRLGNELRRVAPQLRMDGLSITFDRTSKGRLISLELKRCPTPFLGQSALWLEV
jgi:hypothetical protein